MLRQLSWRAHGQLQNGVCLRMFSASARRYSSQPSATSLAKTRNIGIIAHIDAGKTTTTERMLYYSGFTRRIGEVDEGSTVTDFLPAERARGITIQSAAISFHWPPLLANPKQDPSKNGAISLPRSATSHNINLIDTPGHADFTFEVLRSLRILDGAVCILDGVAGVEAQTEKVWKQANQYQIPRIIYVNKLDRDGAAFERTIKEIGTRLHSWPAICHIPWWEDGTGKFIGVGDAVHLRSMLWEEGGDGRTIKVHSLQELETSHPKFAQELKNAREALVELLSEHDDDMVETFFSCEENHLAIPAADITESLRRCTLRHPQKIVPVYSGASFRNIGVQPLLDAVVDLLPSPEERPDATIKMGALKGKLGELISGKMALEAPTLEATDKKKKKAFAKPTETAVSKLGACALAFKVVNDSKRGILVYVRVYSGTLTRNTVLFNTNLGVSERAQRLLKMYANDAVDVEEIPAGQIGVIPGLKLARTGDTLVAYNTGANPKFGLPEPFNSLQLRPIAVPPPVFFVSVEPNSLSEEKNVADQLSLLLREDPSLNVSLDAESGQTQLAGMGELHLEIARDRLINDLKAKASTGRIMIGYREAIVSDSSPCTQVFDREIGGKRVRAGCTASVSPFNLSAGTPSSEHTTSIPLDSSNSLTIHHPTLYSDGEAVPETPALPETLPFPTIIHALQTGTAAALARGPQHRFPMHSTAVTLTLDPATQLSNDTTPAALSGAARLAVAAALKNAAAASPTALMEPVMHVTIAVNESDLGAVVHDISAARGGHVLSLDAAADASDTSSSTSSSPSSPSADDGVPNAAEALAADDIEALDLPLIDPARIYAPPDPFGASASARSAANEAARAGGDRQRQITARVPLREMVGYLKHLRSLTGGRGTFVMSVDRFERVAAQKVKGILADISGGF
ncbi:ribosome-releasing factor 2 [Phyllosticta citriasiana]|uniref:Ribosome-releasing factor 2, mitochondrial n=1 Tax=Phyllosticta citriasiana TaxID=595635 RepID=A0ABR1KLH3_9PEZI